MAVTRPECPGGRRGREQKTNWNIVIEVFVLYLLYDRNGHDIGNCYEAIKKEIVKLYRSWATTDGTEVSLKCGKRTRKSKEPLCSSTYLQNFNHTHINHNREST